MERTATSEAAGAVDLVVCPECGSAAAVEWRDSTATSTGGPVEHVKIHCLTGHRFLMLTERLTAIPDAAEAGVKRSPRVPVG